MVARKNLLPLTTWNARGAVLHPDTAPDVIAARHRDEVAEHLRRFPDATVEEMSAALVLPVWNCERAVKALSKEAA